MLNIGVNTPSAISGKIFEHMYYGKPIISTYSIDNEACIPYLAKYPLSYMIDEIITDLESQAKKLNLFIEEYKNKRISAENIINEFYLNTLNAFINIIEEL